MMEKLFWCALLKWYLQSTLNFNYCNIFKFCSMVGKLRPGYTRLAISICPWSMRRNIENVLIIIKLLLAHFLYFFSENVSKWSNIHILNLLAHDLEFSSVKKHVDYIVKYFRNNQYASARRWSISCHAPGHSIEHHTKLFEVLYKQLTNSLPNSWS